MDMTIAITGKASKADMRRLYISIAMTTKTARQAIPINILAWFPALEIT
jgi:hypothetical protein